MRTGVITTGVHRSTRRGRQNVQKRHSCSGIATKLCRIESNAARSLLAASCHAERSPRWNERPVPWPSERRSFKNAVTFNWFLLFCLCFYVGVLLAAHASRRFLLLLLLLQLGLSERVHVRIFRDLVIGVLAVHANGAITRFSNIFPPMFGDRPSVRRDRQKQLQKISRRGCLRP